MTSQQSFPNFMQLQGVTKLIFYMVLGKFKFLKSVSMEKKSSEAAVRDFEKSIQTVCYSGKEEQSLTETMVDCINK